VTEGFVPPSGPPESEPSASPRASAAATTAQTGATAGRTSAFKAGRGMALAAWVAIAAGVALLIGVSWSVALDATARGLEPASPETTGDLHAMQVVPGMCLDAVGSDGAVGGTTVVQCTDFHRAEVITSLTFDEARYPGDGAVAQRTLDHCSTRLDDVGPSGSSWVAWVPTAQSWQRGDKVALCVLVMKAPVNERIGPDRTDSSDEPVEPGQEA